LNTNVAGVADGHRVASIVCAQIAVNRLRELNATETSLLK